MLRPAWRENPRDPNHDSNPWLGQRRARINRGINRGNLRQPPSGRIEGSGRDHQFSVGLPRIHSSTWSRVGGLSMKLAFYMFWICLVLNAHTYLFHLILPVGHSRTVNLFRANRIVVAMGDRWLERPKFVDSLRQEVSYYNLRHTIRPGITGWAQIRYKCRSSVEDAKEKLRYDLFYIWNMLARLDPL